MDASAQYPVIFIHDDMATQGSIYDLTMDELENETKRLFYNQYSEHSVEHFVADTSCLKLEDDDDLKTEFDAIKHENKQQRPLRIKLKFAKNGNNNIQVPKPMNIRIRNIKSTTAIIEWKIETHKLTKRQISHLSFHLTQISPTKNKEFMFRCNPIIDATESYRIKLFGLASNQKYEFSLKSALHQNEAKKIFSESSKPFLIVTRHNLFMQSHQIPKYIPPPSDLQIIALYPDTVILAWNHCSAAQLSKDYDFEYSIREKDVFCGEIVAATEDENFIQLTSLQPDTQYTFVCNAKYYDPERKLSDVYFQNDQILSSSTNSVTIRTPKQFVDMNEYKTESITNVKWIKRKNELEIFWNAPKTFYGRIEYELFDKMSDAQIGNVKKLPVILTTGGSGSIFEDHEGGEYVITVYPIFYDGDDENAQKVEGKPYDIEISLEYLHHSVRYDFETHIVEIDDEQKEESEPKPKVYKQTQSMRNAQNLAQSQTTTRTAARNHKHKKKLLSKHQNNDRLDKKKPKRMKNVEKVKQKNKKEEEKTSMDALSVLELSGDSDAFWKEFNNF